MILQQGSTYRLEIELTDGTSPIDPDSIAKVEFVFGDKTKLYPSEVTLEGGKFIVPFTQAETLAMQDMIRYQARILFTDNQVKGTDILYGNVKASLSEEVLT